MKSILIVLSALTLAACGVDGEPVYPAANTQVTMSNSSVSVGTNIAMRQGPFTVSMGMGL